VLNAGVEIDCHRRVRQVGRRLRSRLEARLADAKPPLPVLSSESGLYTRAGTSAASISTMSFCECTARGLSLLTSMPWLGARQHDGASTRSPLISTMHARQLPSGRMPGL
jgi:hypothetical protein